MNKNSMRKLLSFILCIVLIAAMALLATGCSDKKPVETPQTGATTAPTQKPEATEATKAPATTEVTTKGEGKTSFSFEVTDQDGTTTKFLIKTDKTVVGEALLEVGLIAGENGPYGLMVDTVNGITADYSKDKAYWAFYENGEYATKGVDQTTIDPAVVYSFVKTPA